MISPTLVLQNTVDGIFLGLFYSLVAIGLALIFGVMDIINFAHGDLLMLAAYFAWLGSVDLSTDPSITALLLVPTFFILGIGLYYGLIQPVIGKEPLIQIAVTVGFGLILQNIALATFKAEPKAVPYSIFNFSYSIGPLTLYASKLFIAAVSLATLLALHLFLNRTHLGLAMRSIADNREIAQLMGINVKKLYALTFGLGTSLIALSASLWMTFGQVQPYLGTSFSLISWVIVALGGLGGVVGVLYSGIIVGLAESLGGLLLTPSARMAVVYVVFFLVLWFKPRGLFGRR
ncbi:MAG: branched-chain amino acid ABC transporter permease [Fervidicoccaceae archaeon]